MARRGGWPPFTRRRRWEVRAPAAKLYFRLIEPGASAAADPHLKSLLFDANCINLKLAPRRAMLCFASQRVFDRITDHGAFTRGEE